MEVESEEGKGEPRGGNKGGGGTDASHCLEGVKLSRSPRCTLMSSPDGKPHVISRSYLPARGFVFVLPKGKGEATGNHEK